MAIQLASDRVSDMNPDLPDLRASAGPLWGFQSVEVCRMKLDMREAWGRCKEKGRRGLIGPVNDLGGKGAPCDSPLCSVGRYCPRSISQILSSFYSL